jgi:hypothetical protein
VNAVTHVDPSSTTDSDTSVFDRTVIHHGQTSSATSASLQRSVRRTASQPSLRCKNMNSVQTDTEFMSGLSNLKKVQEIRLLSLAHKSREASLKSEVASLKVEHEKVVKDLQGKLEAVCSKLEQSEASNVTLRQRVKSEAAVKASLQKSLDETHTRAFNEKAELIKNEAILHKRIAELSVQVSNLERHVSDQKVEK